MKKAPPSPIKATTQGKAWAVMLKNISERVASGQKKTEIAKLLGIPRSKITEWLSPNGRLTGERTPIDKMRHYFSMLGLDYGLYFGEDSGDYMQIPWLEATASMGGGSLEVSKEVISHLSFRTDWLLGKGSPSKMAVINASGSSMEPTIVDGSVVLIDESKTTDLVNGKIYFVCYGEEVFLKRLKVLGGRAVALISDADNSERMIDPDVYFRILGRAIWTGREL